MSLFLYSGKKGTDPPTRYRHAGVSPCFSEIYMKRSNLRKRQLAGLGGFGMVFGRTPNLEQVEPVLFFQLIVYQYPGAVTIFIHLALALILAAARAVQKPLRASGDRTDKAGQLQDAVAAGRAFFQEYAV